MAKLKRKIFFTDGQLIELLAKKKEQEGLNGALKKSFKENNVKRNALLKELDKYEWVDKRRVFFVRG